MNSCSAISCCSSTSGRKWPLRVARSANEPDGATERDTNDHEHTNSRISDCSSPTINGHHMTTSANKDSYGSKDKMNHGDENRAFMSETPYSIKMIDGVPNTIPIDKIDIEKANCGIEHFSVRVQGMDCTGCEKKLYKSLASLTELSNIKTSLLLAQAEFDLFPSIFIHGNNIINTIEKMTGFTCKRFSHPGAELELVMENTSNVEKDVWPVGVTNLSVLSKNRILVTYHPKTIGAREILGQFFSIGKTCASFCSSSSGLRERPSPRHMSNGHAIYHVHFTCSYFRMGQATETRITVWCNFAGFRNYHSDSCGGTVLYPRSESSHIF